MADPTYRASMLPIGTYADPNGGPDQLGWAVPGMIEEPLNAFSRLFGTPSQPGTFGQGPDAPGNADDMRTLLFSMYGGNALSPGRLMEGGALRDAAQATYRTVRHPLEPSVMGPGSYAYFPSESGTLPMPSKVGPSGLSYGASSQHDLTQRFLDRMPLANDDFGSLNQDYMNALMAQGRRSELDVIPGDLLSDTGKPSLMGSAVAGAEGNSQRMYHGTGVPEDFSTFTPSGKGSLGPGVYLSKEADTTLPWANNGPNPRIMPVDVSGRIASYDDFLAARQAVPDQAAAIQSLMDQGFSGAAMDVPGKTGNMNVTNVFKPGSIRSATTGETLFSDTGLPSLWGSALYPDQDQEPRNALLNY